MAADSLLSFLAGAFFFGADFAGASLFVAFEVDLEAGFFLSADLLPPFLTSSFLPLAAGFLSLGADLAFAAGLTCFLSLDLPFLAGGAFSSAFFCLL